MASRTARAGWTRYLPRLLLIIPFLVVLWVPFYNSIEPELGGIPFFYWYQLAWILLGALIVLIVYVIEIRMGHKPAASDDELDAKDVPGDIL